MNKDLELIYKLLEGQKSHIKNLYIIIYVLLAVLFSIITMPYIFESVNYSQTMIDNENSTMIKG